MFVTCPVLKLDKSKDVNELQPLNMEFMLVTFSVLKFDKSKDINELQP